MAEDQGVVVGQQGRVALDLGQGGAGDLLGEPLAAGIEALHLGGEGASQRSIGGGEQFDAARCISQPPQGVETRSEDKADMLLGDALGSQAGRVVDG